ncbi:MAG: ornithine decarboxylase [Dehalococcoidales bacterium]|nr:ornithine decarboxylase [Dehalococcoidales bacterium]|tara:strand:+ start:3008 stop:4168 length:1161 start_codon:yes stop_codon:yes gene_type:complete
MSDTTEAFSDVGSLLRMECPKHPVYCIFPNVYRETVREFLGGFPGRVLYAVKANSNPTVLKLLTEAGVCHFDCASLPEIEQVDAIDPNMKKYFMIPTRIRDAARTAQEKHDVRHFMVDHLSGLSQLVNEIETSRSVIFARMAVHHESATEDLSVRFGAQPEEMPLLLQSIRDSGAEPALAFNVGSSVTDPEAYRHAVSVTRLVLEQLPFQLRLIDVGGGYPKSYPGFIVPEMAEYFEAVDESFSTLPLADNAEVLGEPGRALAAPGMSAVVEVLLRKDNRLYINDGMFGVFWLLRIDGPDRFPVRTYRNGALHEGEAMKFQINGPTCDSTDTLPGLVPLPADIRAGDYLEFGNIGAYSISGRTDYNGYYSDRVVTITSPTERPPAV